MTDYAINDADERGRKMKNIDELASQLSLKQNIYNAIGMRNVAGLDLSERVKLDVDYKRAEREYLSALSAYQTEVSNQAS